MSRSILIKKYNKTINKLMCLRDYRGIPRECADFFSKKFSETNFPPFNNRGFSSLAEIVLVMGIMAILFTISTFSLSHVQQSSSLSSVVDIFITNLKEQQIKAMNGYSVNGTSGDHYGIQFNTNSYTLFRGPNPALDPDKFVVDLPSSIQATTTHEIQGIQNVVVFNLGNGEVASWNVDHNIIFRDTSANIEKTILLNELGVVKSIVTN